MKFKISAILLITILVSTSSISAQSGDPVGNPLEELNFEFLFSLGFGGYINDVTLNGETTIVVGEILNDLSTGGQNTPVRTTCEQTNHDPSVIKGEFSDTTYNCGTDGILVSLDQNGEVIWGTYVGGPGDDSIEATKIDNEGNIIIVGRSEGGLITDPTFDDYSGELGDPFVLKLGPTGERLWGSYIGGDYLDSAKHVIVDDDNNIILSGYTKSDDFPLVNPIDDVYEGSKYTGGEMFVTKFTDNGSVVWSTYIGGAEFESDYSLAFDNNNNLIVTGLTKSEDFPFLEDAQENSGLIDVFLLQISPIGELIEAKLLGGWLSDVIYESEVDNQGNLVMMGYTTSRDFPIVDGYDNQLNTDGTRIYSDVVVAKTDFNGEIIWSTYLGGESTDRGVAMQLTDQNEVVVVGRTSSLDFPYHTSNDITSGLNNLVSYEQGDQPIDIFVSLFTQDGGLGMSFYFGGEGNDYVTEADLQERNLVITGYTQSDGFPTYNTNDTQIRDNFIGRIELPTEYDVIDSSDLEDANNNEDQGFSFTDPWVIGIGLVLMYRPTRIVIDKIIENRRDQEYTQKREEMASYLDKIRNDE